MSGTDFFVFAPPSGATESGSVSTDENISVVKMDRASINGCIYGDAGWYANSFRKEPMVSHQSDELLMLIGSDPDDSENLNAEVEIWIENDRLCLTKTCIVFIPAGVAHGRISVKNLKKPVFHYSCHVNTDIYEETPAKPTADKGTYANNWVERYEPVNGRLPQAPEGFLTRLLWIDTKKLAGAPYLEAVWFHTVNDTGPEEHSHDFDEFIGFFGTDINHPDELNAELSFYINGETVTFTKSCLLYIPRGVSHSPILVPRMNRPIIHFSGGNGGDYIRQGTDQF